MSVQMEWSKDLTDCIQILQDSVVKSLLLFPAHAHESAGGKQRQEKKTAACKENTRCVPGCFQLIFTLEMWQNELNPDSLHTKYRTIFERAVVDKGKAGKKYKSLK